LCMTSQWKNLSLVWNSRKPFWWRNSFESFRTVELLVFNLVVFKRFLKSFLRAFFQELWDLFIEKLFMNF
jgi:hypothetical protein